MRGFLFCWDVGRCDPRGAEVVDDCYHLRGQAAQDLRTHRLEHRISLLIRDELALGRVVLRRGLPFPISLLHRYERLDSP